MLGSVGQQVSSTSCQYFFMASSLIPVKSVGRAGLPGLSTHFHLEEETVVFSYGIDPQALPFRCLLPPFNSSPGVQY